MRMRADALRVVWCGRRWWWSEGNEIRRKKERNLQGVDGRRDCVRIRAWAVVADEGKKKKKTHQVQMVDANACGRVADSEGNETRKKERKKLKLTGCGWLTRLRADAFHVRGLWTRMRVTKKVKVKTYQV